MAIELTTASDSVIDSIRASLSAIGSDTITEIVDITRAGYNALTKDSNTLYVVNEGVGVNSSFYKGTSKIDFSGSIVGNLSATGIVYAAGGNSNTWNNTSNIISINSPTWNNNSTAVTTNSANWILDGGNTKGLDLNIGTNDDNDVYFKANGSAKLTIKNSGNIGINRLNPASKLEVFDTTLAGSGSLQDSGIFLAQTWNTTGSPVALKVNVTNTSSGLASKLFDLRVSDTSRFNVNADGNVGIGASLPTSKLEIVDTTTAQNLSGAALNITHFWNAPGVDVTAIKLNVSSSASGNESKLLDLQIGGNSFFHVRKTGSVATIGSVSATRFISRDLSVGTSTIDWSTSDSFYKTIGSDTTFTFANTLPGQTITVVVNSTGNYSVAWPASIAWESGFYPTQSKSTETDIYTFKNVNGTIRGSIIKTPVERRVGTYAELSAAVLLGGTINITEMITIPSTVTLSVSGTKLIGVNGGGLIFPYQLGSPRFLITVRAPNCEIRKLNLTSNHPLTVTNIFGDTAIYLSPLPSIDNLIIEDNNIYNISTGIYGSFSPTAGAPYQCNIRIQYNNIHAWAYAGIYISGNTDNLLINKNAIASRDDGQTHSCGYNNIWVGENCNYPHITNNEVSGVGRVGIEFTNSETSSLTLSGNQSGKIAFNNVYSPTTVSSKTGILTKGRGSLHVVNNTVIGPFFKGLEIFNGPVNRAPTLVQGNYVEGISGVQSQFIALNNARSCNLVGNTLTTNICAANPNSSSWGINILNGGEDITIKNNHLTNVGTAGVYISGLRRNMSEVIPGSATRIKVTVPFTTELYNGKTVYISGLSAQSPPSSEWGAISGYHNVTLVDSTGAPYVSGDKLYFTIPVNSTSFSTSSKPVSAEYYQDANMISHKYNKIAICSNKFVNTYKQNSGQNPAPQPAGPPGYDYNILFTGVQNAVVRNNEFWVASNILFPLTHSLSGQSAHRTMSFLGGGTFYLGGTSNPVVINSRVIAGFFDVISGDNLRIDYIEGVSDISESAPALPPA